MKRPKGPPPRLTAISVNGGCTLFDVDDLPTLHGFAKTAESSVLLPPDEMIWRLRDSFTKAIAFGTLANANPPPAEHRDHLARIAQHAEALCRELGMPFANTAKQTPNARQVTISPGFMSLTHATAMGGNQTGDLFRWSLYASLVAPDARHGLSGLSKAISAAYDEPLSDEEAENLMTRSQIREALTRGIQALPLLIDVARFGQKQWARKKANTGKRPDQFRRILMADLAALYRDAYGRPPNVTDRERQLQGPAAEWIVEVLRIAARRLDRLPVAAGGEVTQEAAGHMVAQLARLDFETLAEYFQTGWNTVKANEARNAAGTN